ncbi:activating transcription factor 4b [Myripristis murdjan]|uniref:Cyclic AMP-dependent transcription factor ATF-4 n=1 Tax=Myripristis murdjan TaxID=586833 RepID=A0A667Y7Y6_9TELE|nr:cyclic AMP-dependent transcription factor ATF-4-like [Myripristis murdjan]
MTMMMTSSQFGLDDMEALLWGPSSPMADAMGSVLFHSDQEEQPERGRSPGSEGGASLASLSSSPSSLSSPPPFYSPPPSPPALLLHGDKAGTESDLLPLPWLAHPDQLGRTQTVANDSKEDAFGDLDWMTERVDLSEFDLDSLIGSCSPDMESPSSPEDLLASLDCPMELDSLPLPTVPTPALTSLPAPSLPTISTPPLSTASADLSLIQAVDPVSHTNRQEAPSPPPCVPEPQEELEIKSEPVSPSPSSPLVHSPPSPTYTLDLGSEVDVSECEVKPVVATVVPQPLPRIVLSLSSTRIVLVLAPKDEIGGTTTTTVTTTPETVQTSPPASTSSRSPRSRPYPDPKSRASPPSPTTTSVKVKSPRGSAAAGANEKLPVKSVKDKKQKKMEQNKTAATRYRQKKRAEQEALSEEYAELERKNIELTEKADSMAREIQYLKELMEEVRLARIKKGLGADL